MRFLLICLTLVCLATPARALTEDDAALIQRAESYLRNLSTVKARFVQTAPDGTQVVGTFYLNRPGRLRFEYDAPIKDFVVADGTFIYYYDGQTQQQTNAPIGQTLADFLLRGDLKLSGDVTVQAVRHAGGYAQITLSQTADPSAGSLTLAFREDPSLALKKWRIVDPQGQITEVELFNAERDVALSSSLFSWRDPAYTPGQVNK